MIEALLEHEDYEPIELAVSDSEQKLETPDELVAIPIKDADIASEVDLTTIKLDCPLGDEDEFKPKWMPSYRKGDEVYQPLTADVIHDWHIGRRDSYDLKTIEYWVNIRGELLVHERNSNSFTYLR